MHTLEELGFRLTHVPKPLRAEIARIWYEGTDAEFWMLYEWLSSFPPVPDEKTVDEYVRSQDPFYWAPEEVEDFT